MEVSVVSRNYKKKGLFRMTRDEVSSVSGGVSGRFLVLTGQSGYHYVQKTLKGIQGNQRFFFLLLFLSNNYALKVW